MAPRVVAVSMMKDEADVAEAVVRWTLAQGVAHVVVADNHSVDGTRETLLSLARSLPVTVLDDPDPRFLQGEKTTRLARLAVEEHGAEWVVPFDADELWTLPTRWPTRRGPGVLASPIHEYVCTGLDDAADPNPFTRLAWRRGPQFQKVIARFEKGVSLEDGSHWTLKHGARAPASPWPGLFLRHFPVRSVEQMHAKYRKGKRALDAAGLLVPTGNGTHWRAAGEVAEREGLEGTRRLFLRDRFVERPDGALVHDPVRWPDAARVGS